MDMNREHLAQHDPAAALPPLQNWQFTPPRSRRQRAGVLAVVLAVAGAVTLTGRHDHQPLRIRVDTAAEGAKIAENSDMALNWHGGHTFELADGLSVGDGKQAVWQLQPKPREMAAVLRLLGEKFQQRPADGTGTTEWFSAAGSVLLSSSGEWYFYSVSDPAGSVTSCVDSSMGTRCADTSLEMPAADEVRLGRAAAEFFTALPGTTHQRADLQYSSTYSATFVARMDGPSGSPLTSSVTYDRAGTIIGASGYVGEFHKVTTVDTVNLATAVTRLSAAPASDLKGTASPLLDGGITDSAVEKANTPAEPEITAGNSTTPQPSVDEPVTLCKPAQMFPGGAEPVPEIGCAVDPMQPPTPRTVLLSGVSRVLVPFYDADQHLWLLPGYRFTDTDGGRWETQALADEVFLLRSEEPAHLPVPGGATGSAEPGSPGTGPDAPDAAPGLRAEEASREIIGLAESAALEQLWSWDLSGRVVARDGEYFAVTNDYRYDRVNITVVDGLVTTASVG